MKIPLFPLPIFLLPQGITQLRIFEPRYLKMVRLAIQGNGFAIVVNSDDKTEISWASWVDIIDFSQDEDGKLIIDVKCKALLDVESVTADKDNLHFGEVMIKKHWPQYEIDNTTQRLSKSLSALFKENEVLSDLYRGEFVNKANWVVSRWIELLPLELSVKNEFSDHQSFAHAKELLKEIILTNK